MLGANPFFIFTTPSTPATVAAQVLPQVPKAMRLVQCYGEAASAVLSSYNPTNMNGDVSIIASTSPTSAHCWLANLPSPWLDVRLPFGVVIGDSIAEGHPGLHGRLHPSGAVGYDPAYVNQTGQLSYEFGKIFGIYWYNHGIGSQTTANIWARWRRDVLAETYDPGDGRGAGPTLARKPYVVFINAGINDIAGTDVSVTKANLLAMAKSAQENGILAIFSGLAPANTATAEGIAKIHNINAWMVQELPAHGAIVVEVYEWAEDDANPDKVRTDLYIDTVHPSRAGYKALARYIATQLDAPLYLKGLVLESPVNPAAIPSNLARPTTVTATSGTVSRTATLSNNEQQFFPVVLEGESDTVRLTIDAATAVTGSGTYAGWSKVRAVMTVDPNQKTF